MKVGGGGKIGKYGTIGLEGVPGIVVGGNWGKLGSEGVDSGSGEGRSGGNNDGVGSVGIEGNGSVGIPGKFRSRRLPAAKALSRPWIDRAMRMNEMKTLPEDMLST